MNASSTAAPDITIAAGHKAAVMRRRRQEVEAVVDAGTMDIYDSLITEYDAAALIEDRQHSAALLADWQKANARYWRLMCERADISDIQAASMRAGELYCRLNAIGIDPWKPAAADC